VSGLFDFKSVDIECECGKKHPKTIGWLKTHSQFMCSCGTKITLEADEFRRDLRKIDEAAQRAGFK